jgi:hypothetical protein
MIIALAPIDGEPPQFSIVEFQVSSYPTLIFCCGARSAENSPVMCAFFERSQGDLIPTDASELSSLEVGWLQTVNNKPVMTIGPHLIEGKVEKLSTPLLVLRREDGALETPGSTESFSATMVVAGIAKQKLLFKSRPKLGLKKAR